jgi:hypothetical protein
MYFFTFIVKEPADICLISNPNSFVLRLSVRANPF